MARLSWNSSDATNTITNSLVTLWTTLLSSQLLVDKSIDMISALSHETPTANLLPAIKLLTSFGETRSNLR